MYYLRAPYLLTPILALAIFLALDKIFLLPEVRDNFIQPGGMMYYRQRAEQIGRMRAELPTLAAGLQTAAVFGDSRSFALGQLMARSTYARARVKSEWRIYNFAGPQAVPTYHAYLAEKLFSGIERPDYLILGLSPDGFNRNAGILGDPVLKFGVDADFIERHRSLIPAKDYATYLDSRRFALMGLNFSVKALYRRIRGELQGAAPPPTLAEQLQVQAMMKDWEIAPGEADAFAEAMLRPQRDSFADYSLAASPERLRLDAALGAQYQWAGAVDDASLKRETERLVDFYLKGFSPSQEQFFYLQKTLDRAALSGARIVVFWPRVNPHLRAAYEREPRIRAVWRRIVEMTEARGGAAIDLNEPGRMACDNYYDASHMSYTCFPEVAAVLLAAAEALPGPGRQGP